MKIGELFVALGFKVDAAPLDEVEKKMEGATLKAGKLAVVVNAVNVAMLAMVDSAMRAAVGLRLWEQTTGGSADELQRWSNAAKIVGLQANDLRQAVQSLQDARNSFALGEPQNVGAWSILGVDPTQDPFAVLRALRTRMAGMRDPNLMRGLLGKVGMSGVMPLLQSSGSEFDALERTFMSRPQIDRLAQLNREWQRLLVNVAALKNQLAAGLAPALKVLATVLGWVAHGLTLVTDWLNSNNAAAKVARVVIGILAVGMLALGAGLAIVTAGLAAVTAAMLALEIASGPVLPILGAISGTILLLGVLVAALVLIVDDLITAMQGGESVSGVFADWLIHFDSVYKAIEKIWQMWDKLVSAFKAGGEFFERKFHLMMDVSPEFQARLNRENMGGGWFTPAAIAAQQRAHSQTNNIEINVDGAQHPDATAKAVNRSIKQELESAAYQLPVPNY